MSSVKQALRLAFRGRSGFGKDVCATHVHKLIPSSTIIRFAEPIYNIANFIQRELGLNIQKDRQLLRWIGGDFLRNHVADTIWLDLQLKKIDDAIGENRDIIIPDLRQPIEYNALTKRGFTIVELVRGDVYEENHEDQFEKLLDGYPSDFTVNNDGDIAQLHCNIEEIIYKTRINSERY